MAVLGNLLIILKYFVIQNLINNRSKIKVTIHSVAVNSKIDKATCYQLVQAWTCCDVRWVKLCVDWLV